MPALYSLKAQGLLSEAFGLIDVARADKSEEAFRSELENGLRHFAISKIDDEIMGLLLSCVSYIAGDASDPVTYQKLGEALS